VQQWQANAECGQHFYVTLQPMQFPMIDVLRAMAALLVMVYHVTALGQWSRFSEAVWGLPFRQGWIGVDLFLVISGFVITLSAAKAQARRPCRV
jgi:peptidoglycan/LPS O-acetylase OafA/YrhL